MCSSGKLLIWDAAAAMAREVEGKGPTLITAMGAFATGLAVVVRLLAYSPARLLHMSGH